MTLHRTTSELKKVEKDKDRAENKVKEVLKEGAAIKKRANDLLRFSSENSVKSARKNMSYAAKNSGSYYLNENDLKIHKWLDKCLSNIVDKETIANSLKKHCEQQLALLHKKTELENKKQEVEDADDAILLEMEEEIESLESQLILRNEQIYEIRQQLSKNEKISPETTLELLKRNFAATLPSAQDVIKVLINMIIRSRNICETQKLSLKVLEERDVVLKDELDDTVLKLASLTRTRAMDLDRVANEHEEKLQGLFTHSSIGQLVLAECKNNDDVSNDYNRLVAFSRDQIVSLKNQLMKEQQKNINLLATIDDLELNDANYKILVEDKDIQIKFLEDERRLFQDMADELRAGVSSLGGNISNTILTQVVDKVNERRVGLNYIPEDSEEDEEDEYNSETILGEFDMLADEIQRNGGVFADRTSTLPRGVVYDRLTNPSNFTGSMKNVFEQDLAKKREKVQHIKQQATKPQNNKKDKEIARRRGKDDSKFNQIVDYLVDENTEEVLDTDTLNSKSDDFDRLSPHRELLDLVEDTQEVNVFERLNKHKLQSFDSKISNDQLSVKDLQHNVDSLSVTDRLYAMKTTSLMRRQYQSEDSKLSKTFPQPKEIEKKSKIEKK